ncbi:hypothetical protein [Sphingomonas oryzagri]
MGPERPLRLLIGTALGDPPDRLGVTALRRPTQSSGHCPRRRPMARATR